MWEACGYVPLSNFPKSFQIYVTATFCGHSYFTSTTLQVSTVCFTYYLNMLRKANCSVICWRTLGVAWALRRSTFLSLWVIEAWTWPIVGPRDHDMSLTGSLQTTAFFRDMVSHDEIFEFPSYQSKNCQPHVTLTHTMMKPFLFKSSLIVNVLFTVWGSFKTDLGSISIKR